MFNEKRELMFNQYNRARNYFIQNPNQLIEVEHHIVNLVNHTIAYNLEEIKKDYNEASYLYPFCAEYQPVKRGRDPRGDQVPWIEVGEHAVGEKINRFISSQYRIAEVGLPSGADDRFVLYSDEISKITQGFTNCVFLFLDIKSVGPRDNFDHTVVSPYQVSGDGVWNNPNDVLKNSTMMATGARAQHIFHPAISPIYVLSDGTIAPSVHLFVKPIYKMLRLEDPSQDGQPLDCITNVCLPNGLLLTTSPNYLQTYPSLFYPGKDDAGKDPLKIRARVSFELLRRIASWRYSDFPIS